ncbi:hypothetical protein F5878DRAFT_658339 [Lentinula raphanica]|uniref:Uncharacterized protein n=1 Tax=Lentinula raphanica TaxID=153919 RepID=A0AA38PET7_9AGAR|nr:hypothetical protein F5878DRAFT_658339 [Lentinula raphanica]
MSIHPGYLFLRFHLTSHAKVLSMLYLETPFRSNMIPSPYTPTFLVDANISSSSSYVLGQDSYRWLQGATLGGFAVTPSARADSAHSDESVPPSPASCPKFSNKSYLEVQRTFVEH